MIDREVEIGRGKNGECEGGRMMEMGRVENGMWRVERIRNWENRGQAQYLNDFGLQVAASVRSTLGKI